MEPETNNETVVLEVEKSNSLHKVTPLSKYLAMALFIILPFVGGWIGYQFAPEKVVEVNKIAEKENVMNTSKEKNVEILESNQDAYLESMACGELVGEFCSVALEIDGLKKNCILGTSENGVTISYQTKQDLLSHCRDVDEEEMFTCESDVVYEIDECWCHEGSLENVYQLDGKDVLFCASEGLDKEVLDRIDNLLSETTPADEIILPNGMSLEEYSRMRDIEITTFERIANTNYYKDTKNVYVFNEGDIYTESGLVETGGIPSECAESNLEGCVPEEIGRCQTWMMGGASYGKNERGVFVIYNDNSVELLDVDKNSFRYLEFVENYSSDSRGMGGTGFAVDKNNVYVGCGDLLEDESPDTFNLELYLETNNTAQ